ncbi:hypothetical protein [Actinomadura parmotrematis]|uniref:Phospholipid carrier-dependent glycosyltransferase n=1 Tax=Actinomadura parmotrematis TaxID=2864039 RepID=A0ABS7FW19_9ACTN|nr:hypothetical protein [Actinomadura parmotrematis]MBW8484633.1 hypothetical protein [Actinomadura parmotrematis]
MLERVSKAAVRSVPSQERVVEAAGSGARSLLRWLRAHGLFAVVLAGAAWLRWTAIRGYPTMGLFGDSHTYLQTALDGRPSQLRPGGYSLFLLLLKPAHDFRVVLAAQHALGLLVGVIVYALCRRAVLASRPRWPLLAGAVAALATVPVLYDAYTIQLEHMMMSDSLFTFGLVAGVALVMWRRRTSWWAGALAGLAVSAAAMVRSVGLPMLIVVLVCLALRRAGWRPIAAAAAAAVLPVAAYMTWFHAFYGTYSITTTDKIWLYGRTVAFAKCSVIKPEPRVAILCRDGIPPNPAYAPALSALWGGNSGFRQLPGGLYDPQANELAGAFATAAITEQPGDYLAVVWRDTWRAFAWRRTAYPSAAIMRTYEFPVGAAITDRDAVPGRLYGGRTADVRVVEPYAATMRGYQSWAYLHGTPLGIMLAVGLAGIVLRIRRLGGAVLLPWSVGLALLVVPAATADFDYRYVLPAVPFAVLAAVLACVREPGRRPAPAPAEDRAVEEAGRL